MSNENIASVTCCGFAEGQTARVFNSIEWSKAGDKPDLNKSYWQKAKILKLRYKGEWLADVQFENGLKSNGHFVRGIKHCM